MKGGGNAGTWVLFRARAVCAALLALIMAASVAVAGEFDPRLLPARPSYARSARCAAVRIAMPSGTHALPGSNRISPRPADIPMG